MKIINFYFSSLLKIFGMLFLCCCTACAPTNTKIDPTNTASADAFTWQIKVKNAEIKDRLSADQVTTTYDGGQQVAKAEQNPETGNVYLLLELQIKKTKSQPSSFEWKNLTVRDVAGRAYQRHANDSFLANYSYTPRLTGLELKFGENSGWVCFEIPAGTKLSKLTLNYTSKEGEQNISIK